MAHRTRHSRPSHFRRAMLALTLAVGTVAALPHAARADDEEEEHYDARVMGYDKPGVEAKGSGVGLVWVLLALLGGGTIGVMFMNPKRSHLD